LSDTAGEKLITRCTEAEAQPFEAIMLAQNAYDHALEVAIKMHTVATAGLNGTRLTQWKTVCVKYGLKDVGNYVVRRIDGRPFIVELAVDPEEA
jgi:hypothetical protein